MSARVLTSIKIHESRGCVRASLIELFVGMWVTVMKRSRGIFQAASWHFPAFSLRYRQSAKHAFIITEPTHTQYTNTPMQSHQVLVLFTPLSHTHAHTLLLFSPCVCYGRAVIFRVSEVTSPLGCSWRPPPLPLYPVRPGLTPTGLDCSISLLFTLPLGLSSAVHGCWSPVQNCVIHCVETVPDGSIGKLREVAVCCALYGRWTRFCHA